MTAVADASIVIRLLANRGEDDLLRQRLSKRREVHAPAVIDAEVASGVRGLILGGKVDATRGTAMLEDFASLRITRHPMRPYLRRVVDLRGNLTAYDAFYVALAETLGFPLLTRDAKFARSAGHHADIHIYPR